MRNNRDCNGRPTFFGELSPLKRAIEHATKPSQHSTAAAGADRDSEALIAAQRKRQAKQQRRLQRERGDVLLREEKLPEP